MKALWACRLGIAFLLLSTVAIVGFAGLMGTMPGLGILVAISNRLTAPLLTIGSASGTLFSSIELRDIAYADGIDTVRIDSLALTWKPTHLFNGQVQIDTVHGSGVQILLGTGSGNTTLASFSLPLPVLVETLSAENILITSNQREVWRIRAGTLSTLTYRGDALHLRRILLESPALALEASGHLRTSEEYPLELNVAVTSHPEGYAALQGHGVLHGPLNDLTVEATAETPFPARITGALKDLMADTTWQARLEIPSVTLSDIHESWPQQPLSALVAEGRGTFNDYTVHLRTQGTLPGRNDQADLTAEFDGNGDGLKVRDLHLRHHATELSAQGDLTWSPHFAWRTEVRGAHLDPALLHVDWPGDLALALSSSGQLTEQGIRASLHLPKLQGVLRQRQLVGAGELHVDNTQIHIPNLRLQSGGSSLSISGTLAENIDLLLRLDSPNLVEFWPGAHGKVNAHGHLAGNAKQPGVDFKLSATNVGLGASNIQKLQMDTQGRLSADGNLNGFIRAEKLQFGAAVMTACQLRLAGSLQRLRLEFEGQNSSFAAGFSMDGALEDNIWRGTVNRARFADQHYGEWRQRQPASLEVTTDKAGITPLCLATASSTACAEGSWHNKGNAWHMHGTTTSLQLAALHSLLPASTTLSGLLNVEVDITGNQDQIVSAQLAATNRGMSMSIPLTANRAQRVTWKNNALQASYTNGQLRASLESTLTDGSAVHAVATSAANRLSLDQILHAPISGSLQMQIHDLSPFIALTDRTVLPSGKIQGQVSVSGTPLAPVITGRVELTNGHAEIPPLGLTFAPLELNITGDAHFLRLLATAHSGQGALKVESELRVDRLANGPYTFHLTGESFQAAHIPGLDLEITPDILVTFDQHRTEAHGIVTVPRARITTIDLSQGVSPSTDMAVIDEEEHGEIRSSLPFYAELTVITGDDVIIDAHGLRGHIDGKLTVLQQPGRPQTGNGTLSIRKGSYTLYGRRLKIDLGRLLFAGGPLTNPGVELRSEKKNEKVTTGVIIGGFLQRPEIHFYSSPVMEQSAIVTNLLESTALGGETRQDTGFFGTVATKIGLGGIVPYLQDVKQLTMIDEIKFEAGDTYDSYSLVFGSWLTPDFYVSYGKDLVKESGSFNTRYNLGSGFSFLTETGASRSGGDIKYEFEH